MLLGGGAVATAGPAVAAPSVYTVTSTGDVADEGTRAACRGGTGACTLRAAILEANEHVNDPTGPDQIEFLIAGQAPHVISPSSPLPPITDPVVLDAGLPPAGAPRNVELTGVGCAFITSVACAGLVVAADGTTIRGLAINAFFTGVHLQKAGVLRAAVLEGNYIGTSAAGDALVTHPVSPLEHGIFLQSVADSRIGGDPARGAGNVIAGSTGAQIDGIFVTGTRFLGNRLGTDPGGTAGLGGGGVGVRLSTGSSNVVGGPGAGNVISGLGAGVQLLADEDALVQSNMIGVDVTGSAVIGNAGFGIEVQADRAVIGGTPAGRNVVSGNSLGIDLLGSTDELDLPGQNEVSHNLIGTDVTGNVDLGNRGGGITNSATQTWIAHNVVSGNGDETTVGAGIDSTLAGAGARIEDNQVGVSATGDPLGNTGFGIALGYDPFLGSGAVVGGEPAAGNHIAYNGDDGVVVGGSQSVFGGTPPGATIRGNSVHDNGGRNGRPALGIELRTAGANAGADGIDPLDADVGANDAQNAPEVLDVTIEGSTTVITTRLRSTPDGTFVVDLYDNSSCDDTGFGEGERWLTQATVQTPGGDAVDAGSTTVTMRVPQVVASPRGLSATATNANGSTSEFSACTAVPSAPPAATATTYTGPTSAVYSDPVTLSGRLEDVSGPTPVAIAGRSLAIALGTMSTVTTGPTGPTGSASAAPVAVTLVPGPATAVTSFAGDSSYAPSADSDPVTVLKEDCTLSYTGDTVVGPLRNTRLQAQFGEDDSSPGAWAGKRIDVVVTDTALVQRTFTSTTTAEGTASLEVRLDADVYGVSVRFAGDEFYNPCSSTADTLLTVEAAGTKVTGGGWFNGPAGRTSFGLNLIPQTDGAFRGQLQAVSHGGRDRFHADTVSTARSLSATSVQWSGTGRWNGVAGYSYVVKVTDNGSSGSRKADTIDLRVHRTAAPGSAVFTSGGGRPLGGGNLTVH